MSILPLRSLALVGLLAALPSQAGVHVTVHADPGHYSRENAAKLVDLAKTVGARGHRLTVVFGNDWGEAIEAGAGAKRKLRAAVLAGHKAGFHHHDCGHAGPDGYIAEHFVPDIDTLCKRGFVNEGTVEEAFESLVALQAWLVDNGVPDIPARALNIAAQGPNSGGQMRLWEWQPQNIYATGTVKDNDGGLGYTFITFSGCKQYSNDGLDENRWDVPEVGHAQLDIGDFDWNLQDLDTFQHEMYEVFDPEGAQYRSGAHLGMVFHAREFDGDAPRDGYENEREYILAFFDEIEAWGLRAVAADALLRHDRPCASAP